MKKKILIIGILFFIILISTYFYVIREKNSEENHQQSETVTIEPKVENTKRSNDNVLNNLIKHIGFAEEALGYFKIDSADEAIRLWAEGIKAGNGVLQYAVMDTKLQQEFKKYLEVRKNITWDTRKDNEVIESYEIIDHTEVSEKIKIYNIRFIYTNDEGIVKEVYNTLTVIEENNRWMISSIR